MAIRKKMIATGLAAIAALFTINASVAAGSLDLRVAGNFSGNKKQVDGVERPFFASLARKTGIDLKTNYNPMDMLGIKAADALRLLKSGVFDVMSVQIGMAARDDPFFEGLDIAGVSPNMRSLRKAVDAYRAAFDKRLQSKFNAKVMTLWPFGPQVLYCNADISSLADLKGKKVRTFTASMSALVESLGATSITLQFPEVYPALQRGVADCAVTAPTAGNSANWPEVVTHFLPLGLLGAVQGHFMNLNTWKKFTPDQQRKLSVAFKEMENEMWDLAINVNDDAVACNVGASSCKEHKKFDLKLVPVTTAMITAVKSAAARVTVPQWAKSCNRVDPKCSATWNATVGRVAGITAP